MKFIIKYSNDFQGVPVRPLVRVCLAFVQKGQFRFLCKFFSFTLSKFLFKLVCYQHGPGGGVQYSWLRGWIRGSKPAALWGPEDPHPRQPGIQVRKLPNIVFVLNKLFLFSTKQSFLSTKVVFVFNKIIFVFSKTRLCINKVVFVKYFFILI